jgi:hypothetical protein
MTLVSNFKNIFGENNVDVCVIDPINYWNHEKKYKDWGIGDYLKPNFESEFNEAKRRLYEVEAKSIEHLDRSVLKDKVFYDDFLYDVVVVSFPPSLVYTVEAAKIAPNVHLYLGHRLDYGSKFFNTTSDTRKTFFKHIKNSNYLVTSCNVYDQEYFKYYMGYEIKNIPLTAIHAIKFFNPNPDVNKIFIGPFDAKSIWRKELNNISEKTYGSLGSIDDIYKNLSLMSNKHFFYKNKNFISVEEIAKSGAVINMPYSAWSASEYEFHAMGLPLFVPDDNLIIKNNIMDDRALSPLYAEEKDILISEIDYFNNKIPSPQTHDTNSQKYWINKRNLKNKTFYEFSSLEDLSNQLSKNKYIENRNLIYNKEIENINNTKINLEKEYEGWI